MASNGNNANGTYSWSSLKPMPTKRVFSTPLECDGKLYVVGGCDQRGSPLDSFEVFNPSKQQWQRLQQMPTKRAGPMCVAVGKKIVALGGVAVNQEPLNVCEVYDLDTKKWTVCDPMIDKLMGVSGCNRDGKVIVVGGMSIDTNPKDHMMAFDVETNRWQSLPPMPTARYATSSYLINDKLYVIGGRQGKLPCAAFEVFDFVSNKWQKLPDIPSKRVFPGYTASETHIFSVGGLNQNPKDGFSDTTEAFDLETETWKVCKNMTNKRGDFAIGYLGNQVIASGGLGNAGKPLGEVDAYDVATDEWTSLPDLPLAHCSCASILFKDRLHVIGGLSPSGPTAAMEALAYK